MTVIKSTGRVPFKLNGFTFNCKNKFHSLKMKLLKYELRDQSFDLMIKTMYFRLTGCYMLGGMFHNNEKFHPVFKEIIKTELLLKKKMRF
jgi:hypothetical protein